MSLGKGRKCAETCLDLLNIEIVNYYSGQKITPPQAAIDAIGMVHWVSGHFMMLCGRKESLFKTICCLFTLMI